MTECVFPDGNQQRNDSSSVNERFCIQITKVVSTTSCLVQIAKGRTYLKITVCDCHIVPLVNIVLSHI
jgi:hypothetical protein